MKIISRICLIISLPDNLGTSKLKHLDELAADYKN